MCYRPVNVTVMKGTPLIQALVRVSFVIPPCCKRYPFRYSIARTVAMTESTPRFTLYMSGTSYFAQKVMLAFFEKKEPFVEKLVNQRVDDNYAKWFMELNPIGKVPVLEDRGKIIPESEDIIEHLDREVSRAPRLLPDPASEFGAEVARFRKLLNVGPGVILHGVAYNPQLVPEGKPGKTREELDALIDGKIAKLEKLASEHPELRDAYLAKIPELRKRKEFANPDVVQKAMDDFQLILDEVESRLVKTAEDASGETWLLGSDYTAADISLTVLLRRLSVLGLSSLYFTSSKRPTLYKYWQRLQNHPPFCQLGDIAKKYGVIA